MVFHYWIHSDAKPGLTCERCGKPSPQPWLARCISCPKGKLVRACTASGGRNPNHPGHVDCLTCIDWIKKNQPNLPASEWSPIR